MPSQQNERRGFKKRAQQQEAILESLRKGASRTEAVASAGASRGAFYKWMKERDFADAVDDAHADFIETLESAAYQCAMQAVKDPRYVTMLIFVLKSKAKWNDRAGSQELRVLPGDKPQLRNDIRGELAF